MSSLSLFISFLSHHTKTQIILFTMLREIQSVRQIAGEGHRRWFTDSHMDLYIWQDAAHTVCGFQLCYDKPNQEKALSWRQSSGFEHTLIDCANEPFDQQTPLLTRNVPINKHHIIQLFHLHANDLPLDIKTCIGQKLSELKVDEASAVNEKPSSVLSFIVRFAKSLSGWMQSHSGKGSY